MGMARVGAKSARSVAALVRHVERRASIRARALCGQAWLQGRRPRQRCQRIGQLPRLPLRHQQSGVVVRARFPECPTTSVDTTGVPNAIASSSTVGQPVTIAVVGHHARRGETPPRRAPRRSPHAAAMGPRESHVTLQAQLR